MPKNWSQPLLSRLRLAVITAMSTRMTGKKQSERQRESARKNPQVFKVGGRAGPGWAKNVGKAENFNCGR